MCIRLVNVKTNMSSHKYYNKFSICLHQCQQCAIIAKSYFRIYAISEKSICQYVRHIRTDTPNITEFSDRKYNFPIVTTKDILCIYCSILNIYIKSYKTLKFICLSNLYLSAITPHFGKHLYQFFFI